MKLISTIGNDDNSTHYSDRPTVKVVIRKEDTILILNDGLLPGGGVEMGESNLGAIKRELIEELGISVSDIKEIGLVIQYRNFLAKKYLVYGYIVKFNEFISEPTTLEPGEQQFTYQWMKPSDAVSLLETSISRHNALYPEPKGDNEQGKLYNLTTSLAIINAL